MPIILKFLLVSSLLSKTINFHINAWLAVGSNQGGVAMGTYVYILVGM